MGLLDTLLGNSSAIEPQKDDPQLLNYLTEDETVEVAFRLLRDYVAFTSRRMIVVNKQGTTGKRTSYLSVPYNRIVMFSMESKGRLDKDAELTIHVQGLAEPIKLTFTENESLYGCSQGLATLTCK